MQSLQVAKAQVFAPFFTTLLFGLLLNEAGTYARAVETKDGVLLDVHMKPRSSDFRAITEVDDITIHCSKEPQGGRVNRELVKELSKLSDKKASSYLGSDRETSACWFETTSEARLNKPCSVNNLIVRGF